MIKVINIDYKNGGATNAEAVYELTCSQRADLSSLPTAAVHEGEFARVAPHPGSTCLCTEDMSVHILGADDKWHEM